MGKRGPQSWIIVSHIYDWFPRLAWGVGIREQDNELRPGLALTLPCTIFVTLGKLLSVDDYFFICKMEAFILTSRALLRMNRDHA